MRKVALKFISIFLVIVFVTFLYPFNFSANLSTSAVSLTDLENQIAAIQQKISADNTKSTQLSGQISSLSQKIQVDQDIITQKTALIASYNQQITALTDSITALEAEIADLSAKRDTLNIEMNQRAKASYEDTFVNPIQLVFGNSNINDTVTSLVYFTNAKQEDDSIMSSYVSTLNQYNEDQKNLQDQQTALKASKDAEQANENQLLSDKSNLLAEQNQLAAQKGSVDSDKSQNQISLQGLQAQEAAYINSLTSQYGYPQCGSFGGYPDSSWYANQLCSPHWLVQQVGCLATDLSMVKKYYDGYFVDPINYMNQSSGMLLGYPTIAGHGPTFTDGAFLSSSLNFASDQSTVNNSLASGHPVIVGMWPVRGGSHYVVLVDSLGNNNYMIQNPAGRHPDETLNGDGFTTGEIHQIIIY